jgi:hypothetical protein
MQYTFKVEAHAGKGFHVGLGATDDPAADAQMRSFAGWRWFPWNGGVAPTEAELKASFTALQKDADGNDIPNSSVKHQLDAQLGTPPPVVTDATAMETVKDKDSKDVQVAKKVTFA